MFGGRDVDGNSSLGKSDSDASYLPSKFQLLFPTLCFLTYLFTSNSIQIGSSIQPTIPDDISSTAEDFLEHTFLIDHSDRPSAKVLLQHEFIEAKESALNTNGDDGGLSQQTPTRANFGSQGSGSPQKE